MQAFDLLRLLHMVCGTFFGGSMFTMLMLQSLMQHEADGADRLAHARIASRLAKNLVNPLAYAAFFSGLLYWLWRWSSMFGFKQVMACSPVYIHVMLTFAFLAVGMEQVWKGRARKLVAALERNAPAAEINGHLMRGWIFALAATACVCMAIAVAELKVPGTVSTHCMGDMLPQ